MQIIIPKLIDVEVLATPLKTEEQPLPQAQLVKLRSLPVHTSFEEIKNLLEKQTGLRYRSLELPSTDKKIEDKVEVTEGESSFDWQNGKMKINIDTSLLQYHNDYLRAVGDPRASVIAPVQVKRNGIQLGPVLISPQRTCRVPSDRGEDSELPPGLGAFPIKAITGSEIKLPRSIREAGGAMIPMYQNEAIWLDFTSNSHAQFALKIQVGNVNALTGIPSYEKALPEAQDWITEKQPWLDGVKLTPDVVRQFVAVPLDSDLSVEKQITGSDLGGLQFDLFPVMNGDVNFPGLRHGDRTQTPRELGLHAGDSVEMAWSAAKDSKHSTLSHYLRYAVDSKIQLVACRGARVVAFTGKIYAKTLAGKIVELFVDGNNTVGQFKAMIQDKEGIPPDQQRLVYNGEQLVDDSLTLLDYHVQENSTLHVVLRLLGGGDVTRPEMSVGAGGRILQKIYEDHRDPRLYDRVGSRFHLHVFNSSTWKDFTGNEAPPTPVTSEAYRRYGLPYFHLYDEHVPSVQRYKRKFNPLDDLVPVPDDAPSSLSSSDSNKPLVVGLQLQDVLDRDRHLVPPPQKIAKKEE